MTYRVLVLRRAEADLRHIASWIQQRSPAGAQAWLDAFQKMVEKLARRPESFGAAEEDEEVKASLRQAFFRTRRGRLYRAVFTIVEDEVRILRVRGPGQAPITPPDIVDR